MTYPAKITKALHEVMGKVSYVRKGGENKFHNYKYAGEADLLAVLRPAMVEAGLLLIPSAANQTDIDQYGNVSITMEYTLAHKDGDVWPDKIRSIGTGNDRNKNGVGDKGTYKAITGANKYLLFKLFQIETGDDPERDSEHERTPGAIEPIGTGKHRDDIGAADSWKEWAEGKGKDCDCGKWLAEAKQQITDMPSIDALRQWQASAYVAKRIRALEEHHKPRHDWIIIQINDKREALQAKEAA